MFLKKSSLEKLFEDEPRVKKPIHKGLEVRGIEHYEQRMEDIIKELGYMEPFDGTKENFLKPSPNAYRKFKRVDGFIQPIDIDLFILTNQSSEHIDILGRYIIAKSYGRKVGKVLSRMDMSYPILKNTLEQKYLNTLMYEKDNDMFMIKKELLLESLLPWELEVVEDNYINILYGEAKSHKSKGLLGKTKQAYELLFEDNIAESFMNDIAESFMNGKIDEIRDKQIRRAVGTREVANLSWQDSPDYLCQLKKSYSLRRKDVRLGLEVNWLRSVFRGRNPFWACDTMLSKRNKRRIANEWYDLLSEQINPEKKENLKYIDLNMEKALSYLKEERLHPLPIYIKRLCRNAFRHFISR